MKKQAKVSGHALANLYHVEFEDKNKPSEKGLGYSSYVASDSEEHAREQFLAAEPDCEILKIEDFGETVYVPVLEISDPLDRRLNEYQAQAMTTCLPSSNNDAYMLLNLNGEVGELNSKIAKAIRKGYMKFDEENNLQLVKDMAESDEGIELVEGILKEAGDVLWQLSGFCKTFTDADLGWVVEMNLHKLAARKEAGTIDGNGDGVTAEDGMRVEMWEMDVEIAIQDETSADGKDFVRISPNISATDRSEDYDICLTREQVEDFIDALRFIGKRVK